MQEYTTVRLPTESVAVLEKRVRETEFESVAAYLTFLIEELSYQIEREKCGTGGHEHGCDNGKAGQQDSRTEMDEEALEQRLRSLGYLDGYSDGDV